MSKNEGCPQGTKVSEEVARDVKDDLMTRMTDQQRALGKEANPRECEEFLRPILQKTFRQHEEPAKPVDFDPVEFLRKRQEKRAKEMAARKDGWRTFSSPDVHATTTFRSPRDGKGQPLASTVHHRAAPRKKYSARDLATKAQLRRMRQIPEWRHAVEKIIFSNDNPPDKEKRLRQVLANFQRVYGDPLNPSDLRIQVGGTGVVKKVSK